MVNYHIINTSSIINMVATIQLATLLGKKFGQSFGQCGIIHVIMWLLLRKNKPFLYADRVTDDLQRRVVSVPYIRIFVRSEKKDVG